MKSPHRSLTWLLLILASLLVAFLLLRLRNSVQALDVYPAPGEEISIYGNIGLTFNQPMKTGSVEAHFAIQPQVEGKFFWEGQTLWFNPHQVLDLGQVYQVSIHAGAESETGRKLSTPITWQAAIRAPSLLYLVLDTTGGDLWRYDFTTGSTQALTNTDASVIDFAPNPNGDHIAYAQHNPSGGSDLWRVDRDGENPEMLLDCGQDRCSQMAWSVDGDWIAYTRDSFDPDEERYLPSRVWIVAASTGETTPLYRQPEAFGHSPSFSPDGKRLATYDSVNNAIRILDLQTSQEAAIPTLYPGVGDWSPTGEEIIFVDRMPGILEPNAALYIVNLTGQDLRLALGESIIPNMDYTPPQWSPDGEWIAYGLRAVESSVSKGIWVANLKEGDPQMLTDDPSATFTAYRWDPWGERLVFQRYPISGPISHPSLWLWDRSTGNLKVLIENGARPEWLP